MWWILVAVDSHHQVVVISSKLWGELSRSMSNWWSCSTYCREWYFFFHLWGTILDTGAIVVTTGIALQAASFWIILTVSSRVGWKSLYLRNIFETQISCQSNLFVIVNGQIILESISPDICKTLVLSSNSFGLIDKLLEFEIITCRQFFQNQKTV